MKARSEMVTNDPGSKLLSGPVLVEAQVHAGAVTRRAPNLALARFALAARLMSREILHEAKF